MGLESFLVCVDLVACFRGIVGFPFGGFLLR